MKLSRFLITTLATGAIALSSGAAMAEHHDKDGKGGHHKGKFFEKMDTDGDGQISKAEHMSAAEERFAKMDANGDGVVTKEELHEKMKKMKGKWKKHKEEKMSDDSVE